MNKTLTKLPFRIRPGQLVVLKANKKEGWKRQIAVYDGWCGPGYEGMASVTVLPEFREDDYDDGLREVTYDQLAPYKKTKK